MDSLKNLRRVGLIKLPGLRDLCALEHAPALEEFFHFQAQRTTPELYLPVLKNPSLRAASVDFGSFTTNANFERLAASHGVEPYRWSEFQYRDEGQALLRSQNGGPECNARQL